VLSRRNLSYPSRRSTPNPRSVNLLQPLGALFATPVLCFQQLAASFHKIPGGGYPDPVFGLSAGVDEDSRCRRCNCGSPGVGYPERIHGTHRSEQRRCTIAVLASPFRMNTCKSVSKQTTLTPFRMNTCEKTGGGGSNSDYNIAFPSLCLAAGPDLVGVPSLARPEGTSQPAPAGSGRQVHFFPASRTPLFQPERGSV
jgi:hypothetical protein